MLARALPGVVVAVGPRRDAVGRMVEARFGSRVHILDDGFQHLRLARDLDVLSVGEGDLDDRPLPAGRLRERPSASARADVVCVWSSSAMPPDGRTFRVRRRLLGFFDLDGNERPAPARPFLLAGIANPERFWSDVSSAAPGVAGRAGFRESRFRCTAWSKDPARASIVGTHTYELKREDGTVNVTAECTVRATATAFHITINLTVTRNGKPFFHKQWMASEPRRLL